MYYSGIYVEGLNKLVKPVKPSDYFMSRRRFEAGASSIQVRIVTAWTNTVCLFLRVVYHVIHSQM